jgi:hypothetical protein
VIVYICKYQTLWGIGKGMVKLKKIKGKKKFLKTQLKNTVETLQAV